MPIVMSKDEWARIQKWTDACKEDPMAIKRREQLKLMNELSKEMTKDWPNSLENVNKRNEEARRARIEATQQANKAFYSDYVKRKQEDQERRLYEARDTIFKNTDGPKLLLSAVIETAILKERDAQVEFNKQLRARMFKHEHKGDAEIFRKAKEFDQLQEDRKQRRLEADKKNQLEVIEQIKEAEEKARRERELELKMEILDNEKADEEIEALKEFEEKLRAADRARIFADMEQANRDLEARRLEVIARDKMDDRLIAVLNKSKARIESRRRKIEKEIKEERFRVLEGIGGRLKSGDAARDALEQSILEKTLKEQDENAKARLEAENAKRARLVEERKAAHAEYLRREQARLKELEVQRQWEMMNRFKNQELYEVFKQKENMEKEKRLSEYRKELNNLMKDRAAREAAERAATRDYHGGAAPRALRDADARVLRHAQHLLREAEREGRNAWPIHRALQQYCRIHRLSPRSTPDEESPRAPPPRPETPPGGAGVCCETARLQRKLAAEQQAKAKSPPEEGASRLPELPAYHQHGPAFPTLLHPDTVRHSTATHYTDASFVPLYS